MGSKQEGAQDGFRRELLPEGDRRLIKSICRRCGAVIVGSAMDTLPDDELRHTLECHPGPRDSG